MKGVEAFIVGDMVLSMDNMRIGLSQFWILSDCEVLIPIEMLSMNNIMAPTVQALHRPNKLTRILLGLMCGSPILPVLPNLFPFASCGQAQLFTAINRDCIPIFSTRSPSICVRKRWVAANLVVALINYKIHTSTCSELTILTSRGRSFSQRIPHC